LSEGKRSVSSKQKLHLVSRNGLYASPVSILSLKIFQLLKRWWLFAKVVVVNNINPGLREENTSDYFICRKADEFCRR